MSNVVGRLARNPAAIIPKLGYAVDCQELSKLSAHRFGANTTVLRQGNMMEAGTSSYVGNRLPLAAVTGHAVALQNVNLQKSTFTTILTSSP
jgi:hypothetical protein